MVLRQMIGTLEQVNYFWMIQLAQGYAVDLGLEDFEGRTVKVIKDDKKIIIELVDEIPVIEPKKQLCGAMV